MSNYILNYFVKLPFFQDFALIFNLNFLIYQFKLNSYFAFRKDSKQTIFYLDI